MIGDLQNGAKKQFVEKRPVFFEKVYKNNAIIYYVMAVVVSNLMFINHVLLPIFMFFGILEVYCFFYFSNQLTRKWLRYSEKRYQKKLFQTALVIRLVWVLFSYFFYTYMTGDPFEWGAADSKGYDKEAQWLADMIAEGNLQPYFDYKKGAYSDTGYGFFLGWQYWITGKSILISRLIKTVYTAYTCVLIYKLAKRNFGEEVARMAGIFCMLMPNLILYSGLQLKEAEMVFLTVWFMERTDYLLRSKRYNFINIAAPLVLAGLLFFFRTVLGATALFSLFTALIFSSTKVLGMGKRTILIIWVVVAAGYFVGGTISTEIESVWAARDTNQAASLEMREIRDNGNKFAKYAGGAVFAPLIFVIPFPTVVNTPAQENQQFINGGNFVKNITAFFTLLALISIIRRNKWREHILLGSFTIGYLLVVAMSAFAQAERFHQPALPFSLIFAAYGISIATRKEKKYFSWWLIFIFVATVGWSWFKLAGRGLA